MNGFGWESHANLVANKPEYLCLCVKVLAFFLFNGRFNEKK